MSEEIRTLKDYLQQRNAITVLIALHNLPSPSWRAVKRYSLGKLHVASLCDSSYRKLCKQLVKLGLAEPMKRTENQSDYRLTQYGEAAAEIVEDAIERVELWRIRAAKNRENR